MSRRVVQIHPTLLCNLACAHCYSTSGPKMPRGLDPDDILRATGQLAARGYDAASLSGGEPTIYHGLDRLSDGLRDQGFDISLITNGLQPKRALAYARRHQPAMIAVSFDGLAPRHDLIRRKVGSFDRAMQTLRGLAEMGQRTGAVLSVGDDAIDHLPDLVALVVAAGADHVQLHPVSELGRGATSALVKEPRDDTLLRVLLMARLLDQTHTEASITCDALTGEMMAARPRPEVGAPVSPLVIGADGRVFPVAYGLHPRFGFGKVTDELAPTTYSAELVRLIDLCWREAAERQATAFYPDLTRLSQRSPALLRG